MPRPRVYVETTIPSFYFDERTAPEVVRRRNATREWWATAGLRYTLLTGSGVHEELRAGPRDRQLRWLGLIRSLPVVYPEPPVLEILRAYRENKLMPGKGSGDALHLALASYFGCDLLVTWNCKHLANPNKFGQIEKVNLRLGVCVPRIVTPSDLLRGDV